MVYINIFKYGLQLFAHIVAAYLTNTIKAAEREPVTFRWPFETQADKLSSIKKQSRVHG